MTATPSSPASESRRGDPARVAHLGALEASVMVVAWDHGGWLTPREVHAVMEPELSRAYTTVMTILVNLWKKGLLERRKAGRAYAYRPLQTREEWTADRMRELLDSAERRAKALSWFVASIDDADRDQLRRVLNAGE